MGALIRKDPGEFSTLPREGIAGRRPSASREEVPPRQNLDILVP